MTRNLLLVFSTLALATGNLSAQAPSADDVVAKMIERDHERQAALEGYTARRHYVLENESYRKRAEMLVRMKCLKDGAKEFEVVSSAGWGGARKHVFPKLLAAETDASQPGSHERSRIIPANYSFEMLGAETVNQRQAYVIAVTPKTANKYLMQGKIWVDAEEYAIVRIEGQPAKNPSFWIKRVRFVHTYTKQGPFWLPLSDNSVTDVRIFGATELKIEYFGYVPNASAATVSNEPGQRSMP
ncbi:MAG TPA: sigma-E factor regulatory protein RseB domain-containing protein [Candidatus Acidoferrales bacterium]|jgi:outer membrane lipoprotein-sorting protein|nr:sigma-E factor regulatory protein RseB domain-containing protein [Candidatus Acidoferrales bacterium]